MQRRLAAGVALAAGRVGRALPQGGFARGSLAIATGTGLAQFLAIAASPIITRLFSPSQFGSYAVFLALLAILGGIAPLAFNHAIPLPRSNVAAANLLALCLLVSMLLAGGSLLILLPLGPWLLEVADAPELAPLTALLALGVLTTGFGSAFMSLAVRMRAYGQIATNRLWSGVTTIAVQIGLGALALGAPGLIVGAMLGSVVADCRLALLAWRNERKALSRVTRRRVLALAKRYRRFPILALPAQLLNTIGLQLPLLLVVGLFGASIGGQYALAHRVMIAPLSLVANAVGQTYLAEAAQLARTDPDALRGHYTRTTKSLFLIAIGPVILAALLAPFLFGLIFGDQWTEAGVFAAILSPMYFLQLITNPTHGTLHVLQRQDLHLQREIGRLLIMGSAILVAWGLDVEANVAVAVIAVAGTSTYAWYGLTTWRAILAHDAARAAGLEAGSSVGDEDV